MRLMDPRVLLSTPDVMIAAVEEALFLETKKFIFVLESSYPSGAFTSLKK